MNIYYTAKDIEELAAKGLTEIEVGPQVFLTDFAFETAEQLNIALVKPGLPVPLTKPDAPARPQRSVQSSYNKPRGCQHSSSTPAMRSAISAQTASSTAGEDNSSVNRLVNIMGKIMKRGD